MSVRYDSLLGCPLMLGRVNAAAPASTALSSAFTYNTSGASIAYRFIAPISAPLTDVYVFCASVTGSPTAITAELRNYSSSTKPGSTVHAVQAASAVSLGGKWLRITFASPFTLVQGTPYYLVVYNATATPGSNYATVMHMGAQPGVDSIASAMRSLTTANGYSSATSVATTAAMVLRISDGTTRGTRIIGCPFTSIPVLATITIQRGLYIPAQDSPIEVFGVNAPSLSGVSAFQILKASSLPAATPGSGELDVTPATGINDNGTFLFTPFTLRRGQAYRAVYSYTVGSSDPGYYQIDDGATYADVRACGLSGLIWTEATGGAWVDYADRLPRMQLWLSRLPATVRRITL